MSVQFEPVWSWSLTLLACVAMLAVTWLGYPRRIRHLPGGWQKLLIILRVMTVLLLTLLLLRPVAVMKSDDQADAILYVLSDSSPSMGTEDVSGGGSRRLALLKTLEQAAPGLEAIAERAELRFRDFSDSLKPTEKPEDSSHGSMTALGTILEQLTDEIGRERVPVVLLLSDGRQAASGALDVDPLIAARVLGRSQRAIYSVGFGSTEATTSSLDLALDELDVSREVFQGNILPVRVRLKSSGAQGQKVTVRVLLENRLGVIDGQSGKMEPVAVSEEVRSIAVVTPSNSSDEQIVQLQISPELTGDLKLAVEAEPLPGEVRRTNNRVETIIRVRRGGIRVAYFDVIRPEQRWLRAINDSTRIQLDFQPIRLGSAAPPSAIPEKLFQPGNYDAYIIGDVPAMAFTATQLSALELCINRGAGLMMIGGHQTFGAGGWGQTRLAGILPIEMPPDTPQLSQPQKILPARDGLSHYIMQIASPEQNRSRWDQLLPLPGANLLVLKDRSLAQLLAVSDQGHPMLIGQMVGNSRILVFAGDETWRWRLQGKFVEEHKRFWRQIILWLTKKETDDDQPVWILANPRDLTPGKPTELTFGARDANSQPVLDAEFDVTVADPDGKLLTLPQVSSVATGKHVFDQTLKPGDYWARVRASRNGQAIAGIAVTRFHVNARDPELDDPSADYSMLKEISIASGGELLTSDQLIERLDRWAAEGLPGLTLIRQEQMSLWDNWFVLLLLVVLLGFEWAIRKKRGLV
jgi:uncharacterized membrane protein